MGDETEYLKLSIEDCCTHKLWKARVHGYTEAMKLFDLADDEKAPVFNQFANVITKMVSDSNAVAQEKGLEAVLKFVQNAAIAGRLAKDVVAALILKCLAAPKAKTKELASQIVLMFIEIEKQEVVLEELLKGMQQKNPKTVAACIQVTCQGLKEFGTKVVDLKPLIKVFPSLLEDRDKTVRDETKNLCIEMYRWIGETLKPKLTSLKPVQLSDLETEFNKVKSEKAVPIRYLKSQQAYQAKSMKGSGDAAEYQDERDYSESKGAGPDVDPFELLEPLNVLSKLPSDFYKNIEAKKWQERKEALEALDKILDYPKFEKGDYGELVRALMKIVMKDANVVVVGIATKCVARLSGGLKKNFQPYASFVLPQLLEKFKEKKANVVTPLREAVDAVFVATTLEAMQEDVIASLENKNPSIKTETASFLARCFTKTPPTALTKKLLKLYVTSLLKTLNESDPAVRDSSAEALGTAMKVVGEKAIIPFMSDLDNLKMAKIKECCDKAEVVKFVAPRPKVEKVGDSARPVVKKVLTGGAKKAAAQTAPAVKSSRVSPPSEPEMSQDEVDEKGMEIFSEEVIKGFADGNWKTRLESIESFSNTIKIVDPSELSAQLLVKTLHKKPGLKESNIQVLKAKLDSLKYISENFAINQNLMEHMLPDLVEKLGDSKTSPITGEILSALVGYLGLDSVGKGVLDSAFEQKNPKVQTESFHWLGQAIKQNGSSIDVKCIISNLKKGLNATNAAVRTSAVSLTGIIYLNVGPHLMNELSGEKPAVLNLIQTEIDKHAGDTVPEVSIEVKQEISEHVPRVDISSKITEQLLAELCDKNWKVRNEALITLSNIIQQAKCIKSNLGELPPVLAQRLVDSNAKIAQTALEICKTLATAMGPSCKIHVRTFLRGFLLPLGDNKQWVRQAASACLETWGQETGYKEFFDGEIIPEALKTGSPALKAELWNLLAQILPTLGEKSVSKDELNLCVPYLLAHLEDRNADVRKAAQGAVLGIMIHVGYAGMMKQAEKLKPSSKTTVVAILDKTRPDLPVRAELPKTASKTAKKEDHPAVSSKGEPRTASKLKMATVKPTVKKEEEVDLTPLLPVNNMKQQRNIDEQRLKVLKWNFPIPRTEFVDLLKEQMTNAKLNKTLTANMFHTDFKYHLKAIDSLTEDLSNTDAIVANLDLILKWMTLRFFDTNPSVLLKGLDYLNNVFLSLIDIEYTMSDCEANSFIPYLVVKIGDPKDVVRDRVKAILKQISVLYSAPKLFVLIMEGLKSKNARQRTECLEELGNLIELFGMSVCQPSPSSALKELAKQISDRDNSVRSAALNAIVKAYYIEGEKIYKMIGNISEKDSSLLAERIKRAGKSKTLNSTIVLPKPVANTTRSSRVMVDDYEEAGSEPETIPVAPPTPVAPIYPVVESREEPRSRYLNIDLIKIDDSFLDSPVKYPENYKFPKQEPSARTRTEILESLEGTLRSTNLDEARSALENLVRLTQGNASFTLNTDHINELFGALAFQLKHLNTLHYESSGNGLHDAYKLLIKCLDNVFSNKTAIGIAVNSENLANLIYELCLCVVEEKMIRFPFPGISKVLQAYVGRLIDNSNLTNSSCAVVKLLYQIVAQPPANPKMIDLVTKCVLKVIISIKKNPLSLDYDLNLHMLLFECHLFFQSFPQHTWKDRQSATPLKAIKTLLLTLVQIKGKEILSHLTLVENPLASELALYLKKLLKSQPDLISRGGTRLTREMSEHLSEVFLKIAKDATAKEGLVMFYEFKKKNPNVDTTAFFADTSKVFQDYVENGLREIEQEMNEKQNLSSHVTISPQTVHHGDTTSATGDSTNLAQYYLDKLKQFHQKAGLPPPQCPDFIAK